MSLKHDERSSGDHLLRDTVGPLKSSRIPSPSTMVLALALADLEPAVASDVVAELVFQKLCWY